MYDIENSDTIDIVKNLPRILIVLRTAWNDSYGTSSTLSNIFDSYNPDHLAHVYVDAQLPCTTRCRRFFQISESALIKKVFNWRLKSGRVVRNKPLAESRVEEVNANQKILNFARQRRFSLMGSARELLWYLNGWKSKELKEFIHEFDPDIVWLDGSTNVFLNRLYNYVVDIAKKPVMFYFMDDNYTWKSMVGHNYLRRYLLRQSVDRLIKKTSRVLTISPKMKMEFDELFHVNSTIITKSIDYSDLVFQESTLHKPIRIVYLGQLIYGRMTTVLKLVEAIDKVNSGGVKIQLNIYTNTPISTKERSCLTGKGAVILHKPVPYAQIPSVISENDVLLFVESLESKYSRDARLSFSTKITDYLCGSKCILAVGPEDSAPIEYFREEDAALVATNDYGIDECLNKLLKDGVVNSYAHKAFECGRRNHEKKMMEKRLMTVIDNIKM